MLDDSDLQQLDSSYQEREREDLGTPKKSQEETGERAVEVQLRMTNSPGCPRTNLLASATASYHAGGH